MERRTRWTTGLLVAALAASTPGCQEGREEAPGVQVDGLREALRTEALPGLLGAGGARGQVTSARSERGVGVAWVDAGGEALSFMLLDRWGRPGPRVQVRAAVPEEESIGSPSLVATAEGFGLAWVDAENGRVWVARLGADGRVAGTAIVHEGLEAPRWARAAWNGRELGLAVGLWRGVYFARVGADGARIGDGAMLAEGPAVQGDGALQWDGRGYLVSWTEEREGRAAPRQVRVGG